MKLSKIALAIAGTSIAVSSQAATISGGALAGLETNETSASAGSGVAAVAMIIQGDVHNALQIMQNFPPACIGDRTKVCAPSLSSAEVRGLLNNSNSSADTGIVGPNGSLASNYGNVTNYAGTPATKTNLNHGRASAGNVDDALISFTQGGSIGGFSCGQAALLEAGNTGISGLDDATVITNVAAGNKNARIGFVHSTELDDTNANYGFVKIDGVAPDLLNLLSSNYPIVSNLHGALPNADKATHGMTVGVAAAGAGVGVAYHNITDSFFACAPLDSGAVVNDANGGGL